jgi:hypothetical protein
MLIMPAWAMIFQLFIGTPDIPKWWGGGNGMLTSIALGTLVLECWMIVEAVNLFPRAKGVLEANSMDHLGRSPRAAKPGVAG